MVKSKKIKLLLLSMGICSLIIPSTFYLTSCGSKMPSNLDNVDVNNDLIFDALDENINTPKGEIKSFTSYDETIRNPETRSPQKNYYPSLETNFKYPGYDNNYETSNKDKAEYDKVMNERVEITNDSTKFKYKYSDAQWITSQIYETAVTNTNNKRVVTYGNKKTTSELKKHKAVDNFYIQNVKDSQQSITKDIVMSTNITGINHIGLYAPAGEIITIKFSDETFNWMKENKTNPIEIVINNSYWDNKEFNDSGKISNRYPYLKTIFNHNSGFDWNKQEFSFGSPFGGSIAINIKNTMTTSSSFSPLTPENMNVSFSVSGAVEELFYSHGYTTEEQWKEQIDKVKSDQITSPMFSANASFFSFSVAFNSIQDPNSTDTPKKIIKRIGGLDIDSIDYPKKHFDKWFDFFYVSYYFSSKDKDNSRKLNMMFCDDIWGGAGAWGGGYALYAPLSWSNPFYNSMDQMNITDSWGLYHEINHNFQQDSAFFKKKGHPQTNQVSLVAYSLIADAGRYRNESRPYGLENAGGWSRLSNSFYNISKVLQSNTTDEYPLYANLLYSFGPYMYMDYVRKDIVEHPNNSKTWTGISEIIRLSHYFKLNLYPAFKSYSQYWSDWGTPTENEQDELNKISSTYPSFDFVGNLYASGSYWYKYDNPENKFVYTQDYTAPYEIEAGKPYTFDFEKNINSTNKNFTWDEIKIEKSTTKNGGKLEIDPTNKKRLIYTPKSDDYSVDEFDVSIIPTNKTNHVPQYKWKIKVKQSIYGAKVENYNLKESTDNGKKLLDELSNNSSKYELLKNGYDNYFANVNFISNAKDSKEGIKISTKFIPNETGDYSFNLRWDDLVRITITDENNTNADPLFCFEKDYYSPGFQKTPSVHLTKDKVYNLNILVVNIGGAGYFEMKSYVNNKQFEIWNLCLLPNANIITNINNFNTIINDPKYKYQLRKFNYLYMPSIFNKYLNKLPNIFVDSNEYSFESKDSTHLLNSLKNPFDDSVWEVWRTNDKFNPIELTINYKSLTEVAGLVFGHRTNNWTEKRPHYIDVYAYDDINADGKLIYDGLYGSQNNDKKNSNILINFDQKYKVNKLKIVFNSQNLEEDPNSDCISLKFVQSLKNPYYKLNSLITFDDMKISNSSNDNSATNWKYYENGKKYDGTNKWNYSMLNDKSIYTNTPNSEISFDIVSNGFSIVGNLLRKTSQITEYELPQFDVYINNEKYEFDSSTINKSESTSLFYYSSLKKQKMNVKIVYKGGGPLIIDYVSTYGNGYNIINK